MDQEIEIKEEPVWLEETTSTSFENYELIPEITHFKEETKSELGQEERMQVNTFEPPADVKDEIIIQEHTLDQWVPCLKEENNVHEVAVLMEGALHSTGGCCKALNARTQQMQQFLTHTRTRPYCRIEYGKFSQIDKFKKQMIPRSEQRLYSCKECTSTFPYRSSLKTHMLTHSGKRPYSCNECNSKFTQKSHLKCHILTHSGERPFGCSLCNSTFTKRSSLLSHMLIHSGERPYNCHECKSSFTKNSSLKYHLLTHSGERPYRCALCEHTFALRGTLTRHLLTHSRKMPKFSEKSNIKNHLRNNSGERSNRCSS